MARPFWLEVGPGRRRKGENGDQPSMENSGGRAGFVVCHPMDPGGGKIRKMNVDITGGPCLFSMGGGGQVEENFCRGD